MHVVALCSKKGGVGKTTLASHLAVAAELAGRGPVALIDLDPQPSLTAWWAERSSHAPALISTTPGELEDDLDRLRHEGCRLAVIDTPPAINLAIQRSVRFADLVLVPIRPSPLDVRALAATLDLVAPARRATALVLNGADVRARITADAQRVLAQHGDLVPVMIEHRVDFAGAMVDGRTVVESDPAGEAARQINALLDHVSRRLDPVSQATPARLRRVTAFGRRRTE